jgi:NADPH-dependent glutamate synthase beta subunit-like oxidoreductase
MPAMSANHPSHCMAVIGGAVAGAEVAGALADGGAEVVVFEQNARPYGKIEDGLPRWHVGLRRKEYAVIRERLGRPGVHFVPLTRIGRDVDFRELVESWGFTGVVLANGAWGDRRLPVAGADAYVGKGLTYQNPFIFWFNHAEEAGYAGPVVELRDGTLVIGGGLSSIDVAKALMLETTRAKLRERGIEVGLVELDVKGIPKILAGHGLAFGDLGLEGCTLYYRRRAEDMPLVEIPEGASPELEQKVRRSRERLLAKAMDKYCFRFEPLCMPDALLSEGDRLAGFRFRRTRIEDGRPIPTDATFERRGAATISSIGSVPEPIEGIEMKGELFEFSDWELGRLDGYPTVFAAGNVITGKGNILASRKHARAVSETIIEAFLGLGEGDHEGEEALAESMSAGMREAAEKIASEIATQPPIEAPVLAALRARVAERQRTVGYDGFEAWLERVTPPDLE